MVSGYSILVQFQSGTRNFVLFTQTLTYCIILVNCNFKFLRNGAGLGKLKIFVYRVLLLLPKNSPCMYFVY